MLPGVWLWRKFRTVAEPSGALGTCLAQGEQKQMNPKTQVNSQQENRGPLGTPAEDGKGRGYPHRGQGGGIRGPG